MNNNTATKKDSEKFKIKVSQPVKYPSLIKGGLVTSYELMDHVSSLFTIAYKDFAGCYISPRVNGIGFDVKLYFTAPNRENDGAVFAFEKHDNRTDRPKGIIAGLTSLEKRRSQQIYTLTDHGYEGLINFFPKGTKLNKHIFEEQQNSNINSGVYAVVVGLDINRILSTIYGEKENGEYLQYQLSPVRPLAQINPNNPSAAMDWILSIQRISMDELDRIGSKVGLVQTSGIPMVGRIR